MGHNQVEPNRSPLWVLMQTDIATHDTDRKQGNAMDIHGHQPQPRQKPWTEFNKDKETITLKGLTGTVTVTAQY